MLEILPKHIEFRHVRFGKVYASVINITNNLSTTVEASVRAGSSDRWSVHPFKLRLKPKQSCEVELKLKVLRFAQIDKAVLQGQRDTFHIKTQLSDQQFYATFFLDPSLGPGDAIRQPVEEKQAELDPLSKSRSKELQVLRSRSRQRHEADARIGGKGHGVDQAATRQGGSSRSSSPQPVKEQFIRLHAPASPPSPVGMRHGLSLSTEPHYAQDHHFQHGGQLSVEDSIAAAVAQERLAQDARNQQVLQVLKEKDHLIQQLQADQGYLHEQVSSLENQLKEAQKSSSMAEGSRRDTEKTLAEYQQRMSAEVEAQSRKFMDREKDLHEQISLLNKQLNETRQPDSSLSLTQEELVATQKQLHQMRVGMAEAQEQLHKSQLDLKSSQKEADSLRSQTQDLAEKLSQAHQDASDELACVKKVQEQQCAELKSELQQLQVELQLQQEQQEQQQREQHEAPKVPVTTDVRIEDVGRISVLEARIQELQDANFALENALLQHYEGNGNESTALQVHKQRHSEASSALQQRDMEIEALRKQISSMDTEPGTSCERIKASHAYVHNGETAELKSLLQQKDEEIYAHQLRISKLESLHKLAQDSALKCEADLASCYQELAAAERKNKQLHEELDNSKVVAAQLNSRVSDLAATQASEAYRPEDHSLHTQVAHPNVAKLQQEVVDLSTELAAARKEMADTRATSGLKSATQTESAGTGSNSLLQDASDAAVQLAESQKALAEAQKQLRAAERAMDTMREDLEQKLRTTAENGSSRIKHLEETVQRLSFRSQPQAEVARLSMDVSRLTRSESKLRSDLMFAEDRITRLRSEVERLQDPDGHPAGYDSRTGQPCPPPEEQRQDHALLASMIDRAEKAEIELSQAKQNIESLKEKISFSANAQERGAGALMAASQALETRASDLERDSVVQDARAKSMQEVLHLQETKVLKLQQTLAEAGKEAASSRQRANAAEERAIAAEQIGLERARETAARLQLENRELAHRLEEGNASRIDATELMRKAEQLEKATRKTAAQVQAELDQATARLKHAVSQHERELKDYQKELNQLQCKLQDAEALASERAMQLAVITDTVEALQAGTTSERDQCVVSLTTQLVASKGQQAGDEKRCRLAEALSKELQDSCAALELKNDQLEGRCRRAEAESSSLKHQLAELKEELQASSTQLRDLQSVNRKRLDEADRSAVACNEAESKAASLQQALEDASSRHLEEQLSARADAQRSRQHDVSSYVAAMPPPPYVKDFSDKVKTLIHESEKVTDATKADWQAEVIKSFQDMVLEADKHRQSAVTNSRIAMDEVEILSTRARALERAKEEAVQTADALAARLSFSEAFASKSKNLASNQYAESLTARDEQITNLQKQLSHALSQVQQASHQAREASAAESVHVQEVQQLTAALHEMKAQLHDVTTECTAMKIELSGHAAGADQHRHAAVDVRDAAIKDYFLANVMPQLRNGSDADQILALTRQVCALKLVESQLLADVSAAKMLSDSRAMRIHQLELDVKRLKSAAESANAWVGKCNSAAVQGGWTDSSALAELQAQLAEKEKEAFNVRCELVEAQQQCSRQQLILDTAEQKQQALRLEADAEINKAKLAAQHSDDVWKAEAQKQQNSVAQQLSAADLRNQELTERLSGQEREWKDRVEELQRRCEDLEKQNAHSPLQSGEDPEVVVSSMSSELARAYGEIEELKNANECLEQSVKSLENTLASIERQSKVSGAAAASVTSAAFSRQLVQCTQAQNEAQRRLKVAARQAFDYEQRLAEQAARIQELKRSSTPPRGRHHGNGSRSAERSTQQRKAFSLSPAVAGRSRGVQRPLEDNMASDQPVEGQAYNSTLSQLHMTLAKKNAEVEHLRSSLSSMQAETAANAQQASGMFSSDTLDKAQRCVGMLEHALFGTAQSASACDIHDVMNNMLALSQQVSANKQQQAQERENGGRCSPLSEGAEQMKLLMASQHSVISSLTSKNSRLARKLDDLKHSKQRLRARLKLLHDSIGGLAGSNGQDTAADSDCEHEEAELDSTLQETGNVERSNNSGLVLLLEQHFQVIVDFQKEFTRELTEHSPRAGSGECLDKQHALQTLQASSQELAAMEATLAVLRHGLQNDGKAVESKSPEDEVQQSATNRKPLQPLSNVNQGVETAAAEHSTHMHAADTEQIQHLQQQLKHARVRIRELEHDCRLNSSVADEVLVLQQQLELTAQQSAEWQQKHADAQLEVKGVASAASVAKADLQGQVHSFEVLLSQERSAHSLQVSQLQQQIEALESDKNSAVKHYDDLSKSMQCASSKADASSQVSSLKQEIEAVKQVAAQKEKELLVVQRMLEEEKQQRGKIVASLKGTIQRVRAAGTEEDRLQSELMQLTTQVVQERRKQEQTASALAASQEECRSLSEQLSAATTDKQEAQQAVKRHTLESQKMLMEMDNRVHSMHERVEMAQAAFTRQIDDMGHSIMSITEHIDIPRAFMEELGTLEQQLQCISDEFDNLSERTLKDGQRKFEQALAREQSTMQEQIHTLSAQKDESQHAADSKILQVIGEKESIAKELELSQIRVADLSAQIEQLKQQMDQLLSQHDQQLKEYQMRRDRETFAAQEDREVAFSKIHSSHQEMQQQLSDAVHENSVLMTRLKAAEEVAESTARNMSHMESSLLSRLEKLEGKRASEVAKLQNALEVLQRDTHEYQQAKIQEVAGLEARIRDLIQQGSRPRASPSTSAQKVSSKSRKRKPQHSTSCDGEAPSSSNGGEPIVIPGAMGTSATTTPSDFRTLEHEQTMAVDGTNIGAVAVHDAIRAAQREGEFEKLARQKAESDLNVTSEALSDANKKVRQLQTQLQEAQKSVTRVSALEVQLKAVQEDLDKKAEDLAGVQKKLKDCKQDVVCKAERLKAAKDKEARLTSVLADLTAEKESHAQTSKKLEQAKSALERKTATLVRLKEASNSTATCNTSTQDLEKKVDSLQAVIDKKDEALKQTRNSAKLSTSGHARELHALQTSHEQAESKLKSDVQKKQSLLNSARADGERMRAEIERLKAACTGVTEGHEQHTEELEEKALFCQQAAACILRCLVMSCRLTLRSSAAMRAGSMTMGNTTVYLRACAPADQLHAGDVASLVGLSTQEVSDLLGTSIQDVSSVVAGGAATVSHVAKVLNIVHDLVVANSGEGKQSGAWQHKLEAQLNALLAVLGAEAQKGERSLQSCIASLPTFVAACQQCNSPQELVQDALNKTPRLQKLTEEFDGMLASAIPI